MQKIKLLCFPYAGGSAQSIYSQWQKYLDPKIELRPIELAGRGSRFLDPLHSSIEDIVSDVYELIKEEIQQSSYAFYGHSMGSLIAYELCQKIKQFEQPAPDHVFFSGHRAPNLPRREENLYHLTDDDFINGIVELGGTSREVFMQKELRELFLPVLRADFEAVELYQFKGKEKLSHDISVLSGSDDDLLLSEILGWRDHTEAESYFYELEGDHFFINRKSDSICRIINNSLIKKDYDG